MAPESYERGPSPAPSLLRGQWITPIYPSKDTSVAGQTAIVTGGNAGLGLACAHWLLELGLSHLILAVRTLSKGETAAAELREKHKDAKISVWQLDMSQYKSVREVAARCRALDRLDIAILNAATAETQFTLGPEGHETMIQVNYLSTALLSFLLLPILKAKSLHTRPGRLTVVNSGSSLDADLKHLNQHEPILTHFDENSGFDGYPVYAASKALAHLWILKLAEKVSSKDVIVNLVDPGFVKGTLLFRQVTGLTKLIFVGGSKLIGRTPRDASTSYIDAAVLKGEETHGSFIMSWKIASYANRLYDTDGKQLADRLWDETLKELSFADVEGILKVMSH